MDVREQRVDALRRIAEECLAGRLVTRARLCKQVKNSLELLEWRKESVKIRPVKLPDGEEEPDGQRTLALALAPAGVRGVQELLSRNEPCESQDLKPEGSIPRQQQQQQQHQQQQQPLVAATQKSPEHRRTAARQLLATMLREGSVRFSPGLPCEVELGEAFPRSASAPEEAPVFTLPPVGSVKQNLANASGNGNGDKHGFVFAELFAGIGGFRLGLESIGGQCVLMAEQDRFCQLTVRKNFPEEGVAVQSDVTELCAMDVPPHHILTAGFPCQSFSQLGARHGGRDSGSDGRLGLNDETRGNLIWHVLRIANATRPAALILENVRGLLTIDGGNTLATIIRGIRAIGYCVDYTLLNSSTVLAQHRERLYFIAVRADLVHGRRLPSLALVQEGAHVSVSSGPGVETTGGSATSCSVKPAAQTSEGVTETNESTIFKFPWPELPNLNRTVGDILEPEETVPASLALDEHRWAKISGSSYYSKHPTARVADLGAKAQTIGSSYKRGWALYSQFVPVLSPTRSPATSTNGVGSSSSDDGSVVQGSRCGRQLPRFFTPREVARLQGFPESFVLDGLDPGRLYHQLGNAVSPPIVAAVGASLIAWLEGKTDSESAAAGVTAALQFVENNL